MATLNPLPSASTFFEPLTSALRPLFWAGFAFALMSVSATAPLKAAPASEELVNEAHYTVEEFIRDPQEVDFAHYLKQAKGVLIFPQLIKGGFILGAEGGTGVFLVRGHDGNWSGPAFYTMAAGSVGLQVGAQISEAVFVLMTDEAVAAMLKDEFKLGADLSLAVAHKGAGIEASSSTDLNADIYAFSKVAGLFGGGSLEGAKLIEREPLNSQYYGGQPQAREIVIDRRFTNPQAAELQQALSLAQ